MVQKCGALIVMLLLVELNEDETILILSSTCAHCSNCKYLLVSKNIRNSYEIRYNAVPPTLILTQFKFCVWGSELESTSGSQEDEELTLVLKINSNEFVSARKGQLVTLTVSFTEFAE